MLKLRQNSDVHDAVSLLGNEKVNQEFLDHCLFLRQTHKLALSMK